MGLTGESFAQGSTRVFEGRDSCMVPGDMAEPQ
jgi:hypothetical protein